MPLGRSWRPANARPSPRDAFCRIPRALPRKSTFGAAAALGSGGAAGKSRRAIPEYLAIRTCGLASWMLVRLVCTIHRRNVRYTAAGAYCSRVEYNNNNNITCLRPSAFAPGPSFEITSCFLFLLSYFLVRLLTFVSTTCPEVRLTFGGGPCYPSPPTFLLRSFCLHARPIQTYRRGAF